MTITEALAELKTIQARIVKKRDSIQQYLARQDAQRDPLERSVDGGSLAFIRNEMQAVADLETRVVAIRSAIQRKNHDINITVGDTTKSLADWLTWRREVMPLREAFYARVRGAIASVRQQAMQKGLPVVVPGQQAQAPGDVIVNVDEKQISDEIEKLETIKGQLDGQLSLKNATVMVEV